MLKRLSGKVSTGLEMEDIATDLDASRSSHVDNPMMSSVSNRGSLASTQFQDSILPSKSAMEEMSLETSISELCNSSTLENWEDEYDQLCRNYGKIDGIELLYPHLILHTRFWTNKRLFQVSVMCSIWNSIPTLIMIEVAEGGVFSILSFIVLVLPWLFVVVHGLFLWGWSREVKMVQMASTKSDMTFPKLLSLMIHYLNCIKAPGNPISEKLFESCNNRHYRYFYFVFEISYAIVLLLIYLYFLFSSAFWLNADILPPQIVLSTLFNLPLFVVLYISGTVSAYKLMVLGKVVWISYHITMSWGRMYEPLQRVSIRGLTKFHSQLSQQSQLIAAINLGKRLRRDCYERYLLCQYFVESAGEALSAVVIFTMLVSAFMSGTFLYLITTIPQLCSTYSSSHGCVFDALLMVIIFLVFASIMIYMALSLAYANLGMSRLRRQMQYNVPSAVLLEGCEPSSSAAAASIPCGDNENESTDLLKNHDNELDEPIMDYEVLGGHEELLAYFDENPIYFKIYGYAFTPFTLHSLIGALVSSLAVALFFLFTGIPAASDD